MRDTGGQKNPLQEIIAAIRKPLAFASKDGFTHINVVKGLESTVARLCDKGAEHPCPVEAQAGFARLKSAVSGIDALSVESKKDVILRCLDILDAMAAPRKEIIPSYAANPVTEVLPPSHEELDKRLNALDTPLQFVKGIGPKLGERLAAKGLKTVEDVLYFLPIRYEDRRNFTKIRELTPGSNAVTSAEVLASGEARYGRRKVFEAAVSDGSGILKLKWFNYKMSYMKGRFKPGARLVIYGSVTRFGHQVEIIHPDVELSGEEDAQPLPSCGIVPIYSQIENFHQKTIRKIVREIVGRYSDLCVDGVPGGVRRRNSLLPLSVAFKEAHIQGGHNPPDNGGDRSKTVMDSLTFDELFMLEIGLALKRDNIKKEPGIAFKAAYPNACALESKLRGLLPFKLTAAQERTLTEIKSDMSAPHPMNRLIQGDVGSGKTVISFISALMAIESGYQVAIMAPTEILAEQHCLTIHKYAQALGIKIILLKGGAAKAARGAALAAIKNGDAGLIIGTHAIIQKDVEFKRLGLAVIDEQHRFGVAQRAELKKKGGFSPGDVSPDILIMTATPIPRTLGMTVFGDLDVSVVDELPPGRTPVKTVVIRESHRKKAYDAIRKELINGRQCYIVYPLVEESEDLSLKDATRMKAHLAKDVFPDYKVGLLHGRLKSAEKEAVMKEFKDGNIAALVCTTVIEVGVDVPNATVMLVEHAERFGLAQLHQLRGRVGRGDKASLCLLLAQWTNSEDTYRRLKVMEETMDGFRIADEDLKLRGPGSFLGTRQSGLPDFRTSSAFSDLNLLKTARDEALRYLAENPGLDGDEGMVLKKVLKARWAGRLELYEVG
ncbi:MAG: ATP-dependent DNA helicase RecG [Deltaproteobacteria bacterium]|nr:ATP-dependent DNA helicase RecG [Deltaproteobacteria bacterium]